MIFVVGFFCEYDKLWLSISKQCLYVHTPKHREAGERHIRDLQLLIDDTFQQFALDDSEDDFEDGDSLVMGVTDSTSNLSCDPGSLSTLTNNTSVTSLKDDVITDLGDILAPLNGSACLAVGQGQSAKSRPTRHSFA